MAAVTKAEVAAAPHGKKWHDLYPELRTEPLPIEPYISQEYFELERERIFRKVWLNVGREEEISKPGDYLVKDLPVGKTSLLIVRGKDGRLRAFHNVCSHQSEYSTASKAVASGERTESPVPTAVCYSWQTELRANWKLLKDAFQEAYHVAFLHKRSLPDSFTSKSNPFAHGLEYKLYPRHHRMSVLGSPEHQPTAVEALAYRFGTLLVRNDFSMDGLPPGVNPTRNPAWALDLNVIFPNFFVDVSEGSYFTYNMWPLAVDRTLWEVRNYFPEPHVGPLNFRRDVWPSLKDKTITYCGQLDEVKTADTDTLLLVKVDKPSGGEKLPWSLEGKSASPDVARSYKPGEPLCMTGTITGFAQVKENVYWGYVKIVSMSKSSTS